MRPVRRMEGRTILKASRSRKGENNVSVPLEVSPVIREKHVGKDGKGAGKYGREKVRISQNLPKTSKTGQHGKSGHANILSTNPTPHPSGLSVEQVLSGVSASRSLDKTFKIPKKERQVAGPSSSLLHEGDSVSNKSGELKLFRLDDHVGKGSNDVQQHEEMEWETAVEEIKGLWPEAHFIPSKECVSNEPSGLSENAADVQMEVDAEMSDQLVIIPDTNIWIHCLSLIRELLDTKFRKFSYPVIVIPWMVLQELDVHGKNPRGPSRAAIHFIHRNLSARHPRIKGQKASNALAVDPSYSRLNADDSILQCALQCQKENTSVVLLTNDKNLKNKAMVNAVLVTDSSNGVKSVQYALQKECGSSNSFSFPQPAVEPCRLFDAGVESTEEKMHFRNPSTPLKANGKAGGVEKKVEESSAKRKPSKRGHSPRLESTDFKKPKEIADARIVLSFGDVLVLIKETFAHIIESKMKEDYGDPDWLHVVKIPPPWTVKSAVQCIIKHYVAVFTEVFGRKVSLAEKLLSLINQYQIGDFSKISAKKYEEEIIECTLGMFAAGEFAMDDIVRKDPKVVMCRQTLLNYQSKRK